MAGVRPTIPIKYTPGRINGAHDNEDFKCVSLKEPFLICPI